MKIYLINPRFPITYWGFEYSNDLSGLQYTSPPLGLATIAGLTPPEIEVEICDENIETINFESDCDIVGLTAYLIQGPRAFEIAREFRQRGKTVVMGGPITSLDMDSCTGNVDVTFVGEAEYIWPQFLQDYPSGTYQSQYIQTEKIDMRDSPIPRFDLLKLTKYSHAGIQTTRGCPFNCEFCDIVVLFGRKVRCKGVEQVIAELREAAKQGLDSIFITDDNFIGNKGYAKKLLKAIIEFNRTLSTPLQYMTQVSINLAQDDELLQLFYEAHFNKVFVGIETPRKESLIETNKGQNARTDLVADVKKIQSYNIGVSAGMIVGFDHDDPAIFQEQLDFIMETDIAWAMTGILQAVPKTPLYERLKKENRLVLSTQSYQLNNTALDVNIIPKGMTKEELVNGYTWLLQQLYSYENYAKRVIGNLKAYTKKPTTGFYIPTRAQLQILWRTLRYYLLTWDRKRRQFSWKILKYTLLNKPSAFYDAMVHLVSFKHLHTYVYEHLGKMVNEKASTFAKWEQVVNHKTVAMLSQRAITTYEDLSKHAAEASMRASEAYEELRRHASTKGQQAVARYEDLAKRAALMNKQASAAYDELRQQAAKISQQAASLYDELEKQANAASQQAIVKYDALKKQAESLSQQIADRYEELSQQAALLSAQTATVSKRVALRFSELEQQVQAARQQAMLLGEELEQAMTALPAPHIVREG